MSELKHLPSPIVVFGADGQVGSALVAALGAQAKGLLQKDADLENMAQVLETLERLQPHAVINAAAYTQVDRAEEEEQRAWVINGEAPGAVARWCAERGIPFVHYSTDYVFSGEGTQPWTETDAVGPLSSYGRSKLEGEEHVQAAGGKFLIFRTSWVYDATGKNFLNTMLRLGRERETLKVVSDQHGAPTYAPDLARATLEALDHALGMKDFPSGVYHLCHSGETTWHGFTEAIFQAAREKGFPLQVKKVEPIPTSAYPTPAKRPTNSRLNTEKVNRVLGVKLPDWQDGLKQCFEILKSNNYI